MFWMYLLLTMRSVIVLMLLGVAAPVLSQTRDLTVPPVKLPVGCTTNVVALSGVNGSLSYVRLRYAVEALSSAQNAVRDMQKDLDQVKRGTDLEQMLSSMITATEGAIDGVRCSAYIWGTFKTTNKDDALVRKVMIKAFNMEANALNEYLKLAKARTVSSKRKTPSLLLKQAEEDAAIGKQQNEASDALLQITNFLVLKSVDISDLSAQHIEYLNISCSEESELVESAQLLVQGEETAYSGPAKLIAEGLPRLKCR